MGKTELAKVLAASLGAQLIRLQCYEGLDVNTARLRVELPAPDAGDPAAGGARRGQAGDGPRHLRTRVPDPPPAAPALESTDGAPPVLLIDEIDRADEEFEAFLLEILSDFPVTIPEIGTIRAERPPRVILTSQPHPRGARRAQAPLPVPLDRLSDGPKEYEIVLARLPEVPERLAREIVGFIHRLREADLTKSPGSPRPSTGRPRCCRWALAN